MVIIPNVSVLLVGLGFIDNNRLDENCPTIYSTVLMITRFQRNIDSVVTSLNPRIVLIGVL